MDYRSRGRRRRAAAVGEAAGHAWKTSRHRLTSKQGNKKQLPRYLDFKTSKKTAQKPTKPDKHGSGDANTAASAVSSIVVRPEDSNLHSVFVQSRYFFSLQSKTNFNIIHVKKMGPRDPWWWLWEAWPPLTAAPPAPGTLGFYTQLHGFIASTCKNVVAVLVSTTRRNSFLGDDQPACRFVTNQNFVFSS